MCSFFIHSFVHPFFDTPIYVFIFPPFIQTSIHSCIIWLILSFVCSSVFLFICSLIRSLVRLLELCLRSFAQLFVFSVHLSVRYPSTYSLTCLSARLFVRSFILGVLFYCSFFLCLLIRSLAHFFIIIFMPVSFSTCLCKIVHFCLFA